MKKSKGLLQKISMAAGVISFIASISCGIYLYFNFQRLGAYHPITGSLEASIFFFSAVGFVLLVIGKSDLPNFKIDT